MHRPPAIASTLPTCYGSTDGPIMRLRANGGDDFSPQESPPYRFPFRVAFTTPAIIFRTSAGSAGHASTTARNSGSVYGSEQDLRKAGGWLE